MEDFVEFLKKLRGILEYEIKLGGTSITLIGITEIVLILVVFFVVSKILRKVLRKRILPRFNLAEGAQFIVLRLTHYALMVIGLFLAINLVGIQMTSLAVVFGLLGVGFAFGLQNITSNFVSGVILLFERPVNVGDYIEVGGAVGRVTSINMRSTTIITVDNVTLIVPNSRFIEGVVTNWSVGDPKIRLTVTVGVAYGSDTELVQRLLLEVANNHPEILKDPEPDVIFKEFADSSLNFELRAWIPSPMGRIKIMSDFHYAIDAAFRENNITIPFPQRDVHIQKDNS
jgi:small-conductance mechanosensitive channel